jgi:Fe-S cluster assembly protein SufD
METNTITNIAGFRKIAAGEPDWLYNHRRLGWQAYHEKPLPDRVVHLWKYTSPDLFLVDTPERAMGVLPENGDEEARKSIMIDPELAGYGFNQGDMTIAAKLQPEIAKKGIVFSDLLTAIQTTPDLTGEYLGKIVGADYGKFEAANMALWNTGFFLYIPPNVIVEKPIYIRRHPTGLLTTTRLLVVVDRNSEVTIIDDFNCHCTHEGEQANNVIEIFGKESSNVKYVNIQRFGPAARIYTNQRTYLERHAKSVSIFNSLGGAVAKMNAGTILGGEGADSQMYGVAFGDNRQHFDYHTYHHHKAKATTSNIEFKVILKDKAQSAYTGLIRIENDAPNCEAYQENRNLLLSKGTKADSIPELEILNDQVRCTHGATVGPLDQDMMFYLKSRGFSESEAVRTLVGGFVQSTLGKMPETLGHIIGELVRVKMEE